MKRTAIIALALLMAVMLAPICFAASAQAALAVDEGVFIITAGGQEMGKETFKIGSDFAESTVELTMPSMQMVMKASLKLDDAGATAYSLDAGVGGKVDATFADTVATLTAAGMQKTVQLALPRIVLENNVFSHYQVLLGYYDQAAAGVQQFAALVPGTLAAYPVSVERLSTEPAGALPGMVEYRVIFAGALGVSIIADGEGRIMSVIIPAQSAAAVRESYKQELEKKAASEAASAVSAPTPKIYDVPIEARTSDSVLRGTLTLPGDPADGPYPAVVLLSGSGPQDRDGNTPPSYMSYIFRDIAQRLASVGVAVARYDDRGVGESEGDMAAAALHGLIDDARAVASAVRDMPGIDAARVALAGHSEGAYIAPILAAEAAADVGAQPYAAVAILAGASTTLDEVILEQLDYQANHPEFDDANRAAIEAVRPSVEAMVAEARSGNPSVDPNVIWIREHMAIEPLATVARLTCPILIVQGEKDVKVVPHHSEALAAAARGAGNENVRLVSLPNTTHEFLQWPFNNPEYDPMAPMQVTEGFLHALESFFVDNLKP